MPFKIERPRYSRVRRSYFAAAYGCTLFSFTLSIAMVSNSQVDKLQRMMMIVLTGFYTLCVTANTVLMIYLFKNRECKYEDAISQSHSRVRRIVYSNSGEEIGFYLKLGIAGFGICSIFFSLLSMNISGMKYKACINYLPVVYYGSQIMFFLSQIVFLLKYNGLIMLKYKRLVKIIIVKIIVLDVLTWTLVVITKITSKYDFYNVNKCLKTQESYISKYFLPFIAEFLIICIAVNYEILCRVGEVSFITYRRLSSDSMYNILGDYKKNGVGFSIALFVVCVILEVFSLLIYFGKDIGKHRIEMIYVFEDIVLNVLGIVTNIIMFHKTQKFQFTYPYFTNNIDLNLLIISAFCSIFFSVQVMILSFNNMILFRGKKLYANPDEIMIMSGRAANALIELFNVIIQTFVLTDSFYRCGSSEYDKLRKPGINAISSLVGINFAMWALKSLQMKKGDIFFNESRLSNIYPTNLYQLPTFFLFFSAPLALLYRYHCSVCYSNVFNRMYEDESDRFEMIMRKQGFDDSQVESYGSFTGNTARMTLTNVMNARMRMLSAKNHLRRLNSKISEQIDSV